MVSKPGGGGGFNVNQPPPPDINDLVNRQFDLNVRTANFLDPLNRPNTFGPFGSSTFGVDENGRVTLTTTPSPQAQQAINQNFDFQNDLFRLGQDFFSNADSIIREPLDIGDLGLNPLIQNIDLGRVGLQLDVPGILELTEAGKPIEDATFDLFNRRLQPEFERLEGRLAQDLANRGLPVGGLAQSGALESFGRTRNDAFQNALSTSVLAGRDERARLFGAMLQEAGFENAAQLSQEGFNNAAILNEANFSNAARQTGINEAAFERNQALNTLRALQGASGGFTPLPQQSPFTPISFAAPDLLGSELGLFGLQLQAAQASDQARREQQASGFKGITDLLGAGITAGAPFIFG